MFLDFIVNSLILEDFSTMNLLFFYYIKFFLFKTAFILFAGVLLLTCRYFYIFII